MSKAKPQGTSRASKPVKSATKSKSSPKVAAKSLGPAKAVNKARPGAVATPAPATASRRIDQRIASLGDWRAVTLAEVYRLIHEADPEIMEEIKWIKPTNPLGVPVWSHAGIVCTGESYKQVVKLTFARGASLADPRGFFNSSLEGNTRRAIDIREGEVLDARAFKALIQAAVAENLRSSDLKSKSIAKQSVKPKPSIMPKTVAKPKPSSKPKSIAKAQPGVKTAQPVKLLSGGNPQIAKADGDAPVQAYIAAMPGPKRDLGKRLDALIVRTVPNVRKAVKWNSPFYGIEGQGWFVSFHVFTRYVKVTFFQGTSLRPVPPGGTGKDARWIDIYEDDQLDEAQMARWVKQAEALPGWVPYARSLFEKTRPLVSIAPGPIRLRDESSASEQAEQVQNGRHSRISRMKHVCLGFIE